MLTRIELENFKRFERFTIKIQSGNILVGPNNSGKSSILDALRILEACYRYTKSKNPRVMQVDGNYVSGYEIPESYLPVPLDNITNNYNDNDAVIKIKNENGASIVIRLHPHRSVRFTLHIDGRNPKTSSSFRSSFPISVIIVPALAPLEAKEIYFTDETVNKNKSTRLAARSFRNIWLREPDEVFDTFRSRVENAWPGVTLRKPEMVRETPPRLEMFFSENRIDREIHWAGFGFQVWLQIHTHLLRGDGKSILVLDEPDIYLHPDLQHKLYYEIKNLFPQFIIATHATEIINEAETKEILVVDCRNRSAKAIRGEQDYDDMLSYIGSAENADFAKISRVKKVLFVEGNDAKILRRLSDRLNLLSLRSDINSPIFKLGGFSQWKRAKHTIWAFKELLGVDIDAICLFDRDYRSDDEIKSFAADINEGGIKCFVLERKEIENYLLCPRAISRICLAKNPECGLDESTAVSIIEQEAENFKNTVMAHIFTNYLRHQRETGSREDDATIISRSINKFSEIWESFEGKISLSPGKDLIKLVIQRIKLDFGISISTIAIANALRRDEMSDEMILILNEIEALFAVDRVT